MGDESLKDFLIRLGFRAGQHVGSSSSYHFGEPKPAGKFAVLYPLGIEWAYRRDPFRAAFYTVWRDGREVYDGPGEPDREWVERLVNEVRAGQPVTDSDRMRAT